MPQELDRTRVDVRVDTKADAGVVEREHPAEPKRLLVADDEHLVASGMSECLRDLGYTVIGPAADGDQAVSMCESSEPDMALLDIRMPKRNGLEAAEEIYRQLGVPVIIFSAFSDASYIEASNRVGVFGYLLKPVTQDHLRVGISLAWGRFLDSRNQRSEIGRLKTRLENRKVIEQAKWVIVQRKGVPEPDAMRLLQRQARNNRRSLVEVARSVLENEDLLSTG